MVGVFAFGAWRLAIDAQWSPGHEGCPDRLGRPENEPGHSGRSPTSLPTLRRPCKTFGGSGDQLFVLPRKYAALSTTHPRWASTICSASLQKETGAYVEIGYLAHHRAFGLLESGASVLAARKTGGNLQQAPSSASRRKPLHHPGTKRAVVAGISGKWGFGNLQRHGTSGLSRQYARDGVALLIVPASDFVDDGWLLRGRMAMLRGVESGFSIARSAKLGILTASDDRGRVLAERNTIGPSFAMAVANIPVRRQQHSLCKIQELVRLGMRCASFRVPFLDCETSCMNWSDMNWPMERFEFCIHRYTHFYPYFDPFLNHRTLPSLRLSARRFDRVAGIRDNTFIAQQPVQLRIAQHQLMGHVCSIHLDRP